MSADAAHTTGLLQRYAGGDRSVEAELYETVYEELVSLARGHMQGQRRDHTLQPTALVHEAWLRLVNKEELEFEGRAHFYGLASRVMRSVLVDHTRRALREKRGGGRDRIALEVAQPDTEGEGADLLAIEESLVRLEAVRPQLARVVELRFFGGLTHPEIAQVLGISLRSVERSWRAARAWLHTNLSG